MSRNTQPSCTYVHRVIITLCAYAQLGYVFGRVSLCMYMWTKKRAVWGLTTRKSPISVIYCLLVEFNSQKRGSSSEIADTRRYFPYIRKNCFRILTFRNVWLALDKVPIHLLTTTSNCGS